MHELGAPDERHLALAQALARVIVTQDTDFMRIAATGVAHAGIIYAPQGTLIGDMVRGLMLIAEVYTAEEMVNRVEYR